MPRARGLSQPLTGGAVGLLLLFECRAGCTQEGVEDSTGFNLTTSLERDGSPGDTGSEPGDTWSRQSTSFDTDRRLVPHAAAAPPSDAGDDVVIPEVAASLASPPDPHIEHGELRRPNSVAKNAPIPPDNSKARPDPIRDAHDVPSADRASAGGIELVSVDDGHRRRLAEIVGNGRGLLHVVTLPCAPCAREWPEMVRALPMLDAQGVVPVVVGLVPTSDAARFRDYFASLLPAHSSMPTIWLTPDRALLRTLHLEASGPQTVLLDAQFRMTARWVGPLGALWRRPDAILRTRGVHDNTGGEK